MLNPPSIRHSHLESTVQVLHLLGVLSLSHSDALLHLLCLGLDILSDLDELVDCDFEGSNKRRGVEGCLGINTSCHQFTGTDCQRLTSGARLGLRDQLLRDGGDKVFDIEFTLSTRESVGGTSVSVVKVYFEIRDVKMLLDGGIDSVVHVQIRVALDDRHSISLTSSHDPQT